MKLKPNNKRPSRCLARIVLHCVWCGKDKRNMSDWEQQHTSGTWHPLCNPCANRRLRNPYNALLKLRKISLQNASAQTRPPEKPQEDTCPREKMAAMEIALRASIAYDEARFERIRHKCFGEIPERMKGQPDMLVESVLEVAEEESWKEFRQLRDAALCLPENANCGAIRPDAALR